MPEKCTHKGVKVSRQKQEFFSSKITPSKLILLQKIISQNNEYFNTKIPPENSVFRW